MILCMPDTPPIHEYCECPYARFLSQYLHWGERRSYAFFWRPSGEREKVNCDSDSYPSPPHAYRDRMNLKHPIYFSTGLTEKVWFLVLVSTVACHAAAFSANYYRQTIITNSSSHGPIRKFVAPLSSETCLNSNTLK